MDAFVLLNRIRLGISLGTHMVDGHVAIYVVHQVVEKKHVTNSYEKPVCSHCACWEFWEKKSVL